MPRLPRKRADTQSRIMRLERIAAHLKENRFATQKDLAETLGVSARTIARDLAVLRDQGVQIEADRGRGGGLRLDANWGVGRISLSYPEALDLLISIAVAEKMNSPLFLANLGAVRRQLIASFSPEKRQKIERLKSRILIGETASPLVQTGYRQTPPDMTPKRIVQALHQAFVDRELLSIRYRREDGKASEREIEAHYMMLKYPVWYVVAFDHLSKAPRIFRCDRILTAARSGAPFRQRPKSDFAESIVADDLKI